VWGFWGDGCAPYFLLLTSYFLLLTPVSERQPNCTPDVADRWRDDRIKTVSSTLNTSETEKVS
jgi:hypothetical protein